MSPKATDVFAPAATPDHTYVNRDPTMLNRIVRSLKSRRGAIAVIWGSVKTGKTTLARKAAELLRARQVTISAHRISGKKGVFDLVLDALDVPDYESRERAQHHQVSLRDGAKLSLNAPMISAELSRGATQQVAREERTRAGSRRRGLAQVVKAFAKPPSLLVVDKLHQLHPTQQECFARDICEGVEQGLKIIITSHVDPTDDLLRGATELGDYLSSNHVKEWTTEDLRRIARNGFAALNLALDEVTLDALVEVANGSPQKMHTMCDELCSELAIDGRIDYGVFVDCEYLKRPQQKADKKRVCIESRENPPLTSREFIQRALKGDIPPDTTKIWVDDQPGLAHKLKYPSGKKIFQRVRAEVENE
jgi:AAA domain